MFERIEVPFPCQLHAVQPPVRNLLVPENLDLSVFSKQEKAARIIDLIVRRRFQSNLRSNKFFSSRDRKVFYSDRWVNIPSRTLKNIDDDYRDIIEELREHGVIERNYFDREERKAYGYRFTEEYRETLLKCVTFPEKNWERFDDKLREKRETQRKVLKEREKEALSESVPGYLLAFDHLNSITLECEKSDIDGLMVKIRRKEEIKRRKERWQQNPAKRKRRSRKDAQGITAVHRCNHVLFKANEIIKGQKERCVPFYTVDDYGRFHYFLTSLPKSLRPFVRLNGNRVTSYDITSSQCIFFALAVREEARNTIFFHRILDEIKQYRPTFFPDVKPFLQRECDDLKKQSHTDIPYMKLRRYRNDRIQEEIKMLFELLSDDFYKSMMIKAGVEWETDKERDRKRESFKGDFFEFLYGPNKKRDKIFKTFQETFPYITLVLWKMKDLGGMYRRIQEIRDERQKNQVALSEKKKESSAVWKQLKKEARKEKNWYIQLPLRMQRTESKFMFEKIAPQIGRIFLPVHDCILVEKTARKNVKDVDVLLRSEFKKLGVNAHIKKNDW